MNRLSPLAPIGVLVLLLISLEVALEWRHFNRCFDTPVFGLANCGLSSSTNLDDQTEVKAINAGASGNVVTPLYGPTAHWPFRSLVPVGNLSRSQVIWVASASHAEHSRLPPEQIFPNQVCRSISADQNQCLVINGSRAGFSIEDNISLMKDSTVAALSDVAILYQMAIFMARQQRKIVEDDIPNAGGKTSEIDPLEVNLDGVKSDDSRIIARLQRGVQHSSLYLHLSEYVGSTIRLAAFRDDELPEAVERYLEEVKRFVNFCRALGIQPLLTTFATAYDVTNVSLMPLSMRRTLVRQNRTLSVNGYVRTVSILNDALKEFAVSRGLLVVDLAALIGGQPELFVDMVHFSSDGHAQVASAIASYIREHTHELWTEF